MASEERNALLFREAQETHGGLAAALAPEPASFTGADPTQRLLTALGRFHRYVAKGQAGAPQEFWSDDCMNQLLGAVELSAEQNWKQLVEALTGSAQVLQTYEMASAAHLCVPFLNDSYEILCLMVGDLIVNNTRSGAMQAWRKRYQRAVEELTAAGLTLVEDEPVSEQEQHPQPLAAQAQLDGQAVEPQEDVLPFPMPEEAGPTVGAAVAPASAVQASDEPSIDDFLPFVEGQDPEPEDEDGAPFAEEAAPAGPADAAAAGPLHVPKPADEVAPVLDAVCDDLALLEKAGPACNAERLANIGYRAESLAAFAADNGFEAASAVSRRMLAVCRASLQNSDGPVSRLDDAFLDLAYAFCGVYAEALEDSGAPAVKTWIDDTAAMLERLQTPAQPVGELAPPDPAPLPEEPAAIFEPPQPATPRQENAVETPSPEPARAPEDGSPESLLVTAQRAIAHGDMPGAKVLALQAVAHLARAEMAKAEARVQEAEAQFQQNAQHIETARLQVKKAEQEVALAETRAAEGGSELADARAHCSLVEEKVVGIERRVAEIEDQIRALQAAREAEIQRAETARCELDEARGQENEVEGALAQLKENEKSSRARLEESRQNVKDLQRHRLELEEMLSRARETLTHHRSSMGDIEKTITQLRPAGEPPAEPGEEMLF